MGKGTGTCDQRAALILDGTTGAEPQPLSEAELEERFQQAPSYPERMLIAHQLSRLRRPKQRLPEPRLEPQRLDEAFEQSLQGEMAGHPRAVFLEDSLLQDGICYVEYSAPRVYRSDLFQRLTGPVYGTPEYEAAYALCDAIPKHVYAKLDEDQREQYRTQLRKLLSKNIILLSGKELTYEDWLNHLKTYAPLVYEFGFDAEDRQTGQARDLYDYLTPLGDPFHQKRWITANEARFAAFAQVAAGEAEEQLLERLRAEGATIENNPIEVPEYESSHEIEGGKRYKLPLSGGVAWGQRLLSAVYAAA